MEIEIEKLAGEKLPDPKEFVMNIVAAVFTLRDRMMAALNDILALIPDEHPELFLMEESANNELEVCRIVYFLI